MQAQKQPGLTPEDLASMADAIDVACRQLRACSLALRSVHDADVPTVEPFMEFRKDARRESVVYNDFLMPMVVAIVLHLDAIFEHYMTASWEEWDTGLFELAHDLWEREWLCDAISHWFLRYKEDVEELRPQTVETLAMHAQEAKKFRKDADIQKMHTKIQDTVFVWLLFAPAVNVYAATYVYGDPAASRKRNLPYAAQTPGERAAAASLAVTEALPEAAEKIGEAMAEVARVVHEMAMDIEEMLLVVPFVEKEWDRRKHLHREIVRGKGWQVRARIRDIQAMSSLCTFDLEELPFAEPREYAQLWLEVRPALPPRLNGERVPGPSNLLANQVRHVTNALDLLMLLEPCISTRERRKQQTKAT